MSTEGMSIAGIARVLGVHPTTVRRWLERAGAHAKRFSEERRRTPARARKPLFVECVLELLRGHDHFIKPHLSLSIGREHHTPALVAGGEQRRLILGDSLSWVPPIARGLERVVLDHTQRRHGSPGARS